MAYDYLYLSTVPIEEPCLQVGKATYKQMADEARAYADALYSKFASGDCDIDIRVKKESHDFGDYPAVVIRYNEDDPDAVTTAFEIESSEPLTWEELGMPRPFPELDSLRS